MLLWHSDTMCYNLTGNHILIYQELQIEELEFRRKRNREDTILDNSILIKENA